MFGLFTYLHLGNLGGEHRYNYTPLYLERLGKEYVVVFFTGVAQDGMGLGCFCCCNTLGPRDPVTETVRMVSWNLKDPCVSFR